MPTIIDLLERRGLIEAVSSAELRLLSQTPLRLYFGIDPSADSLHVGNLLGLVVVRWFQRMGHTPVILLGGATGKIGDPGGKSKERPLLLAEAVAMNVKKLRGQIEQLLPVQKGEPKPLFMDNSDWLSKFSFIDFLRDVGKHFRIGTMLGKEMIRNRLESEEGMSFTEFSYQLLQAYDFYHLYMQHEVVLQIGGSDQWGNITAGIEFVRKLIGKSVYGLTFPLLVRSDGKKFGKSEEGAVWLDPHLYKPYDFYQYFLRIPDSDAPRFLRLLTFVPLEEIEEYESNLANLPPHTVQRRLAEELTRFVHGETALKEALHLTESLAPGSQRTLTAETLQSLIKTAEPLMLDKKAVIGTPFAHLLVLSGLSPSKSEATRLIQNGGGYLNESRISDPHRIITPTDVLHHKYLLLSAGKKNKLLIELF